MTNNVPTDVTIKAQIVTSKRNKISTIVRNMPTVINAAEDIDDEEILYHAKAIFKRATALYI